MASVIHESGRTRKPWRVDWTERRKRRTRRFATRKEAQRFIGEVAFGRRTTDSRTTLTGWLVT